MTQPRYNAFNQIHKALRAMLYDTATLLQRTDFDNTAQADDVIRQLETLLHYFDEHAAHEDRFVLPAVGKYNQQLVDDFEREHVTDIALARQLSDYIGQWRAAGGNDARVQAGHRILEAFNEFIAFNLYHMNKEEKLLNAVLWENYTDQEILGIQQNIVAAIPPQTLMEESRWMMRSISNSEVQGWLTGLKHNAPKEVFNAFLQMGEQELPAARWEAIQKALA